MISKSPEQESTERSLSTRERWLVAGVSTAISLVGTAGYWIAAVPTVVTLVVAWPILPTPILLLGPVSTVLDVGFNAPIAIFVIQVLTFVLLWAVTWIKVVVLYALGRAMVRLVRGRRPLL